FEIAEQQQPKVPARRQPWSHHHWRVERLTLLLGEPIEAGLVEDGVQSRVERMAGRDGELGGRNPDRPLLALAFAHRHGPQFTVSPAARTMDLSRAFTTGCECHESRLDAGNGHALEDPVGSRRDRSAIP